ncbi:MAG: hypothetical protein EZS28_028940 [Streblomastix strix]|uniref:Uncharacterized protein n=1 Tax=Streblomastix strix TaxID=222440 RepID=A0A5J4UZ71_9EUKA|nr:MAG: hypothetical protein EZS28_028940 [Streblomastix strix]
MNFDDSTQFFQDQPIMDASSKSKKWMFGFIFLTLEIANISWVCLIMIEYLFPEYHFHFIGLAVVFLLFIIVLIPVNSKASIIFNPNNETVTIDLNNITSSSLTGFCCFHSISIQHIQLQRKSFRLDRIFKRDQLEHIVQALNSIIVGRNQIAANQLKEQQLKNNYQQCALPESTSIIIAAIRSSKHKSNIRTTNYEHVEYA